MSNVNTAVDQAYGTIVSQLAAPYFFEKLAAHGIAPSSEKEASEMWDIAQKLHALYTAEQEKVAAAQASTLASANARLDELLKAAGLGGAQNAADPSVAFKQAADFVADQPEIASAVLTLQAAAVAAMQNAQ